MKMSNKRITMHTIIAEIIILFIGSCGVTSEEQPRFSAMANLAHAVQDQTIPEPKLSDTNNEAQPTAPAVDVPKTAAKIVPDFDVGLMANFPYYCDPMQYSIAIITSILECKPFLDKIYPKNIYPRGR